MQSPRISKPAFSILMLLIGVVWLAQTLGAMHRVAHAKHFQGHVPQVEVVAPHPVDALWGDHSNASDCRVFDQNSPDLLGCSQLALTLPFAMPAWGAMALPVRLMLFERFYAAQGPPVALK